MDTSPEIILYQTEDKKTKIEVRLEGETVWLSQKQLGDLFQKSVPTINEHVKNIYSEKELLPEGTIRKSRIVQTEGGRNVERMVDFYNLDVIISVGYRVKSIRGTQFRIWATQRLREYIVKGFVLNDERLKNGGTSNDYFEELLERVRAIRTSEKNFYRKVTDIYATSIDYNEDAAMTREFFQTVQNKFHFAITGHTAAELVAQRAKADKPNMGLTSWKNGPDGSIRKADVTIAKNYLNAQEVKALNLLVDQYLSFAEFQAQQKKLMHMADWAKKLHAFLTLNERQILKDAGRVSHELCEKMAHKQFDMFQAKQRDIESLNPVSDFDNAVKKIESTVIRSLPRKAKSRPKV